MTQATLYIGLNISIHAPPRGATWVSVKDALPPNFNSRPSARGDTGAPLSVRPSSLFQFTPLREGRLNPPPPRAAVPLFQFTPLREGRPRGVLLRQRLFPYFNSRPSARGDPGTASVAVPFFLFQFTPLREGRRSPAAYSAVIQ